MCGAAIRGNEFPRCYSKSAEADCARVGFEPTCVTSLKIHLQAGMAEVVERGLDCHFVPLSEI